METIEEFIKWELQEAFDFRYEMEVAMFLHERIYGVPVGPTLNMVFPPQLKGILAR